MALIKPFETPHKIIASYHKFLKAEIDARTQRIELVFAIYASAEARETGANVLWHEYVQIPFEALMEDPCVAMYRLAGIPGCYLDGAESDTSPPPAGPIEFNPDWTPPQPADQPSEPAPQTQEA